MSGYVLSEPIVSLMLGPYHLRKTSDLHSQTRKEDHGMPGYSLLNSEFNDFLFAPIGEEANEMRLSVLSALARLDIDPWQEAARLNQLPKEIATQSLASMIKRLPSGRWAPSDARVIAARLVQLLPSRNNSKVPSVAANSGFRKLIRFVAAMWLIYTDRKSVV
jgi:hypothetical protein